MVIDVQREATRREGREGKGREGGTMQ